MRNTDSKNVLRMVLKTTLNLKIFPYSSNDLYYFNCYNYAHLTNFLLYNSIIDDNKKLTTPFDVEELVKKFECYVNNLSYYNSAPIYQPITH